MSAATIVSDRNRKRLADLLARLGSEHDGERSADALMAGCHLRQVLGWTWARLVERPTRSAPIALQPHPPKPCRSVGNPAAPLRYVLACWSFLRSWGRRFTLDLEVQTYPSTKGQREKPAEVAQRIAQRCSAAAEDVA